jgi:tripartite-type tricarboxylate transporter receptor subunit TctC
MQMTTWPAAAVAALIVGASLALPASANAWPERAVRVIVPLPVGTAPDVTARLFAERLAEKWKQPVVVENRPGGDGITGVAAFVASRDDHTLLFSVAAPFGVQPAIQDSLPYDPVRDVVPISTASDIVIALTASATLKSDTLTGLLDHIRTNPGQLNWTAGPGLPRYVFAAFAKRNGLDLTHVSYRDFASALQDLKAGRVHLMVNSLTLTRGLAQAGDARWLAVSNRERAPLAPDVPTVVEAGFPALKMDGFSGFYGWRDMPDALRDRVSEDVRAIASDPAIVKRLTAMGQIARGSTPDELADALAALRAQIAEIVAEIGRIPIN